MKRESTAIIKDDEGWWIGWVEEIPAVNSQGKTKAELLRNLKYLPCWGIGSLVWALGSWALEEWA